MHNHEPENYECPFCAIVDGKFGKINSPDDIVLQNKFITAYISPQWWPNIEGNVIIIPNKHFENLYDLPNEYGHAIFDAEKAIAIAFKEVYKSDGVSTRQHNEPAGHQEVWHYHLHVFPRYTNDNLYTNHEKSRYVSVEERKPYADKLKEYFKNHNI